MQTADSFAVALRTARHAAGLTLEELSDASGVSVRALSDMERGRALGPQRRTVVAIADTLKLEGTRRSELVGLAKAGRTRSAYSAAAPGLCELPGSIGDFTGREAELAWIHRLHDLQDAGPAGVAVISGGAGLGKTTLVVRAAHRLRPRFPDGVYFVAAQGMSERPVGGDEILTRVLRALGVRDQQIPQDLAERAGRYRQLLRERRVLVVIDDVHSEAQVRPALPGGGNSLLLVTSRRLLAGLEGVRRLHLDPMPASDASDLLRRILAERPDPTREHDLQGLVDLLSGLPLALRIAGNRLVSRPGWSPAELIARLSAAERRLDQLTAGDLKVAAAFDMSYEQLPDVARQLFRRAALVPGTDFSTSLVSVAGALTVAEAEEHLDDLVDLSLVECVHGDRYRLHDLVRLYAHGRLDAEESAEAVTAARRQMVAWLLDTATSAGRMFAPDGGSAESGFGSPEEAKAWLRVEAEHWLPALGSAAVDGDHDAVVRAASAVHWYSEYWVHWPRWVEVFTLGLDAARALGDAGRQAEFLNHIAWTHALPWRKNWSSALSFAQQALELARQIGDARRQAWALQYIAGAQRGMGDLSAASVALRDAADLLGRDGNADDVSAVLVGLGVVAFDLGNVAEALAAYERAMVLVDDPASGMTPAVAESTLPQLLGLNARALGRAGRRGEAVPMMLRAIDLFGRTEAFMGQAAWLRILGEELYDADHGAEARASLLRAAELYRSVGQHDRADHCRTAADKFL